VKCNKIQRLFPQTKLTVFIFETDCVLWEGTQFFFYRRLVAGPSPWRLGFQPGPNTCGLLRMKWYWGRFLSQYMPSVLHHRFADRANSINDRSLATFQQKLCYFGNQGRKLPSISKIQTEKNFPFNTVYNTTNYIAIWVLARKGAQVQRIQCWLRHNTMGYKSPEAHNLNFHRCKR
jgi:hypothetical protein